MLKYSLMSQYSNCTLKEIINLINTSDKPCKYTYGFTYRNPTTNHVPITKEKAIDAINRGMCDVDEYEDYIHVNEFSENDMW